MPRINGDWGACDPDNPKNRRTRAALLVRADRRRWRRTTVVIDTGPDFREQMIAAKVEHIDAVLYTHPHADHIHGIDDLRGYLSQYQQRMPIWADPLHHGAHSRRASATASKRRRAAVIRRSSSRTSSIHRCSRSQSPAPAAPIAFQPLLQQHGDIHSLGFRIGDVAYCSDVSDFPPETIASLRL